MQRTYRFRLYPNASQEAALHGMLGAFCDLYSVIRRLFGCLFGCPSRSRQLSCGSCDAVGPPVEPKCAQRRCF